MRIGLLHYVRLVTIPNHALKSLPSCITSTTTFKLGLIHPGRLSSTAHATQIDENFGYEGVIRRSLNTREKCEANQKEEQVTMHGSYWQLRFLLVDRGRKVGDPALVLGAFLCKRWGQ